MLPRRKTIWNSGFVDVELARNNALASAKLGRPSLRDQFEHRIADEITDLRREDPFLDEYSAMLSRWRDLTSRAAPPRSLPAPHTLS